MARLIVLSEESPESFELADMATLGRHPESDVPIIDARASKSHCVVERHGDTYVLRDLGSMNGTFLNGARIDGETRLGHGDEITIGAVRVTFEDPDAEHEVAASDLAFRELSALVGARGDEPAPLPGIPVARLRPQPAAAPLAREDTAPTPPPKRPLPRRAPSPLPAAHDAGNLFDDLFADLDLAAPSSRRGAPPAAAAPARPAPPAPPPFDDLEIAPSSARRSSTRPYPGELPADPVAARGLIAVGAPGESDNPPSLEHAVVHPERKAPRAPVGRAPALPAAARAQQPPPQPVAAPFAANVRAVEPPLAPLPARAFEPTEPQRVGGSSAGGFDRAFFETTAAIVRLSDPSQRLARLLDGVIELTEADRAVAFVADGEGRLAAEVVRARRGASLGVAVSTTLLEGVLQTRATKVSSGALGRATMPGKPSVAVPMTLGGRALGVLWIEGAGPLATSAEGLAKLDVVAGLAALVLASR